MNWASAGEFFHMGGYGLYVWGSYGVTLLCFCMELGLLAMAKRNASHVSGMGK
jgi:heme exporter protein D